MHTVYVTITTAQAFTKCLTVYQYDNEQIGNAFASHGWLVIYVHFYLHLAAYKL